jgi:hypothetical protein
MKKIRFLALFAAAILMAALAFAAVESNTPSAPLTQKQILKQYGFIDENGDGINDLARDADNDGIPNCVDPDWVRPLDGSGYMNRYGHKHQHANQNAGQANGGCNNYNYNYSYNHQWQNSGSDTPGSGDPTDPDPSQNRNRRSNRKH